MNHLIAQKHFLFNKWKSPESDTYKEFTRVTNLVDRRLREAQNIFCLNFFQKLPTIREQGKFKKQKISPSEKSLKVCEIRLDSGKVSRDSKIIVNRLNRSFANLDVFKGSDIACKHPDNFYIHEKSRKFCKKQECVEINKLNLNTNKTELIFFSRYYSDFGSVFFYTKEVLITQKVADIWVFKLTGTLISMNSWIKP